MAAVGGFLAAGSACTVRGPSGSYDPAGYLQNRGAMHPSVIAGAMPAPLIGEPLGGLPLAKSPLQGEVPPQAAEGCGTLPRLYPHGSAVPAPSRKVSGLRYAARRAKSPALQNKANGGRDEKHLSAARPVFLAPVPGLGTCSRQIVGRAFTPAARPSGCRGVSGPMLGIVPQSCRSPQCLGAHSFFPLPSVYRQVARRAKSPALQCKANGRRNRKLCLCG